MSRFIHTCTPACLDLGFEGFEWHACQIYRHMNLSGTLMNPDMFMVKDVKIYSYLYSCVLGFGFWGFWCDAHWTWNLAPSEKSKINSTLRVIAISADPLNMLLFLKVCDPLLTAVFTSRRHVACNAMPHTREQVDRNATVGNVAVER